MVARRRYFTGGDRVRFVIAKNWSATDESQEA